MKIALWSLIGLLLVGGATDTLAASVTRETVAAGSGAFFHAASDFLNRLTTGCHERVVSRT